MNKHLFILASLMLLPLFVFGQSVKHISLSFNQDDFRYIHDEDGHLVITTNVYNYSLKSDTVIPALPYIGYSILIKNTESYDSHTCSCSKNLLQRNIMMAPNPIEIPTNMVPPIANQNVSVSYNPQKYPQQYVEYVGKDDCNGYRLLTFLVCPFEYDASTKTLFLRKSVDFDIRLRKDAPTMQSQPNNKSQENLKDLIRRSIVNPEDLADYVFPKAKSELSSSLTKQTGFEYVIVTNNSLKGTFQKLASWKSRKGIRAKVITTEEIYANYDGATKQEKIKRALADIDNLSYVLLGGDTTIVPTCMCYIGKREEADSITPADAYYSCLGTMNWDNDGDGRYGEFDDSISMLPSLNVSRIPTSGINGARNFVNKIIKYESNPDTMNWQDKILMAGTSLGYSENEEWYPYGDSITGFSDTQIWSQMMYDNYINPTTSGQTSWKGELTRFYDTYTDISEDDTYDFSALHLMEQFRKGYTFVDVMTHGTKLYWKMEPGYSNFDYDNTIFNNRGYTIITTTACHTNAFDYNEEHKCLGRTFISDSANGVLAYWGTSRENWYSAQSKTLGRGARYDGLTYRKLFEDKYHSMGKAATAVKEEMRSYCLSVLGDYKSDRKIWMSLNLLGDPEMPVYLSKPQSFQNIVIQSINDSIYVRTDVEDYDICFINQNDSTDYYIARDVSDSVVAFQRLDGVFDVCITKPGYIPYFSVYDNFYLQNMTLSDANSFVSDNVVIGSDVTDRIVHGPVIVNNGSTIVRGLKSTTITKDFEVKKGAELIINNK
jgi:hypothetical protein